MKVHDLLSDNLAILRRFHKNGIATDSIRFLPIHEDWLRMLRQGYKRNYIVAALCDKYGYTERYIRMIIKFMEEDVK